MKNHPTQAKKKKRASFSAVYSILLLLTFTNSMKDQMTSIKTVVASEQRITILSV